jgi:hypothetical protein
MFIDSHPRRIKYKLACFNHSSGTLSEAFLDLHDICKTEGSTERDELTLCRRHALIVTHVDTLVQQRALAEARRVDKDPVLQAQRAATDATVKAMAAELKAAEKLRDATAAAVVKAAARDSERDAEKVRKAALTAEDKKAELAQKKEASAAKKVEKEEAKAAKLRAALALLEGNNMNVA